MKINRKLLGCSLIAVIILSLISFPSSGMRSSAAPSSAVQDQAPKPPMTAQLVQDQTRDGELAKHFRKYDLVRMDPAAAAAQIKNRGRLVLKSSERDFDVQLAPHDIRSADYSAHVIDSQGVRHPLPRTEVTTFKGQVKGLPNAQVRMSLTEKGIEGAIISRERRLFIQPARAFSKEARPDDFVLYDSVDLTKDDGTCGVTLADEVAAQEESTGATAKATGVIDFEVSGPVQPLTTLKRARIATDADGEYVTAFGGASQANTQIQNILNLVDGIYQVEVGITFEIVQQITRADQNTDPYTTASPSDLLTQFRNEWNNNFASGGPNAPARSLAHLFTGRNLDGTTIGIASFGVVCRIPTFAYGLSQRFPTTGSGITASTVVLTAHEIGHNFAASHTNQATDSVPGDLDRPCESTIMEASVGTGSSFCPFSRSQIAGHGFAHSSCLTDIAAAPPSSEDCTSTSLDATGLTAAGNLSSGDCRSPSRGVEFFADRYTFNGVAGQRVAISAVRTSSLDTYLYLIAPDGYVLSQNDDVTDVDTNSRIPTGPDTITLPQTGVYTLEVSSFDRLQTGTYTITVQNPGCTLSATPSVQHFGTTGGSGTISVTISGPCSPSFKLEVTPDSASWLAPATTVGSGSQNINFNVSNNPGTAGRRAFILVGTAPDGSGGIRIPITQSGSVPDCTTTAIGFGQTLNGSLGSGDCHSPVRGDNFFADRYTFNAGAGQKVAIQTAAPVGNPDTFLTLLGPNGVVLITDDDSGGGTTNSRIPGGDKFMTLGIAGTYTIEVSGFDPSDVGAYSVTLTSDGAAPQSVQFGQSTASVNESQATVNVNVTRGGNVSGEATVNYATTDNFGVNCNTFNGQASAKCDFNTAGGTLRFAAGEASKNIQLSIVNDGYVEGSETFILTLTNPSGMTLGTPATATITIVDNDSSATNPFDNNAFFVRQQYLDFLLREPDTGGFNDWLNVLNNCQPNQGGLGSNPACDRVHVSSGFFRSTEFGERGYWSYRYYHAALGRRPQFAEFVTDLRRLSGFLSPAEEEAQRAAFVADFMARTEFTAIYGGLTNAANAAQFIATLEQRAGVTLPATATTLPGQPPQFGRQDLINRMQSGQFTAAQTLRAFIEQKVVFDAFFFRAFVAMQYFGYLLRDPEDAGYNDWVDVLTNGRGAIPAGDFRHLIFGFVWSVEYRQRFGP